MARARVRLQAGRRSQPDALTASILPTYDLARGHEAELMFKSRAETAGYTERQFGWWPCEHSVDVGENDELLYRDGDGILLLRMADDTLVLVEGGHGSIQIRVAAGSKRQAVATVGAFRLRYPATQMVASDDVRVPITFWTMTSFGPTQRLRMVEASPWADIEPNYTSSVREAIHGLMDGFEPGKDGQLILWQGPPGTGKTWALRALANEWRSWAEFHYITDPDTFFVDAPIYMIDVLLADTYDAVNPEDGSIVTEEQSCWRVLIFEDTGELLSANAKEKYGQGLSRLLNVVDGMIGQGLKVLCLVTTNDELGDLNPAVLRPGRCASQIVFDPLSPEEAAAWLGEEVDESVPLSELYDRAKKHSLRSEEASGDAAVEATVDRIREVAEAHQDEATGYGETAYDPNTSTVYYVCGDWTDPDPIEADMLAIDGVDSFEHEAEALPQGWWDAEVVWPDDPPRWVVEKDPEKAALELARKPL